MLFKISQHRLQNAIITVLLSIIYAITYGCATIPATAPPSPEIRDQLGRIGVVALSSPIRSEFYTTWPKGQAAGALTGATVAGVAGTAGMCLYLSLSTGTIVTPAAIAESVGIAAASINPITLGFLILIGSGALAVLYLTGKGAADGAAEAMPAEKAKQIEQQIDNFLNNMKLSSGLTEAVYTAGTSQPILAKNSFTLLGEVNSESNISYDNFSGQGIKTILEVSVTEIGFQEMPGTGPGSQEENREHPIKFYMHARTRLVEAASDTEIYRQDFQYYSAERPLEAWLETSGAGLEIEFKQVQAKLAELIIHELFLANATEVASMEKENKIETDALPAEKEKVELAYIPESVAASPIELRRQPMEISSPIKITKMLAQYDFFDYTRNPHGAFKNVFVNNNDYTVTDRATGLMWQMSGSSSSLDNRSAKEYVEQLNRQRFVGYADWRMPTIEELASLLTRKRANGVYLDPVFSNRQITCWTVDERRARQNYRGAWVIDFKQGQIVKALYLKFQEGGPSGSRYPPGQRYLNHVKAVRSAK